MTPIAALLGTIFAEVGVLALRPSRRRGPLLALAGNGAVVIYPSSSIDVISSRVIYLDRAAPVLLAHPTIALLGDSISVVLPSPAVTVLAAPLPVQPAPWT